MNIRQDTAKQYREIRNILAKGRSYPEYEQENPKDRVLTWCLIITSILILLSLFTGCSQAATLDQWADAIYKAENSKSHPYGVMVKYRHTSPRQACKNTVSHLWRNYSKSIQETGLKQPFLEYLAKHYAPIRADNDPNGLNRNWTKNVNYFLYKGNS